VPNAGDGLEADNANWNFKGDVARNFVSHVSKSVPYYFDGHKLVCSISDFFIKKDSLIYELGCSTGELILKLSKYNKLKPDSKFIGIDIEKDMIKVAEEKKKELKIDNVNFFVDDIVQYELESSDMIIAYYTVQFIRPSEKQRLIDKIFNALKWGGAFLMFEKVRANDARFQDMMTSIYHDYKLEQGYTPEEIITKSRSLKGILEPFSTQGNIDLLKRAGFVDILTVFKYVCFEGFLAIK
jgi:tRNA (cmo5U34)-methyltransferase